MRWLQSGWSELHGLSGLCILWNQLSSHSLDSHIMLGLMESWFIYFQFIFSPRVKWTSLQICGSFSQFSSLIYITLPCKFLPAPVTLNSEFCFLHLLRLLLSVGLYCPGSVIWIMLPSRKLRLMWTLSCVVPCLNDHSPELSVVLCFKIVATHICPILLLLIVRT